MILCRAGGLKIPMDNCYLASQALIQGADSISCGFNIGQELHDIISDKPASMRTCSSRLTFHPAHFQSVET